MRRITSLYETAAMVAETNGAPATAEWLREQDKLVADLIEAAEFASNVCAELYAKYQVKVGPFASQAQVANGKLRAALARIGGAP